MRRARLPGMPFPLIVLAMMAVGWWRGWLRALHSSSTLCPSTTMACQLHTWGHTEFGWYICCTNKPLFNWMPHIFYLPKSFTAFLIFLHMMLQGGGVTLPQTVNVHDGHQVVKLVIGGKWHGLPDRTLRHFTIPHQAVDTVTGGQQREMRAGRRAGKSHLTGLWQFSIQSRFTQSDSWAGCQLWHNERSQRLFKGVGPEFHIFL